MSVEANHTYYCWTFLLQGSSDKLPDTRGRAFRQQLHEIRLFPGVNPAKAGLVPVVMLEMSWDSQDRIWLHEKDSRFAVVQLVGSEWFFVWWVQGVLRTLHVQWNTPKKQGIVVGLVGSHTRVDMSVKFEARCLEHNVFLYTDHGMSIPMNWHLIPHLFVLRVHWVDNN